MFKDADGNTDPLHFMSKEIIEQTLQTVKFKGVEWDVTLELLKKVNELTQVAGIYGGIESTLQLKLKVEI